MTEFRFYRAELVDKYTYPSQQVQAKVGGILKALGAISGSVAKAFAFHAAFKTVDGFEATVVYMPTAAPPPPA